MISTKKHIQQLAAILIEKGISDVVISPGSRNGPIIHTLVGCGKFSCKNIVDERSAAYFAIGLAQATKKPVAIVCSSGTATLNYAPAIAEAYYQHIPIIAITADRPKYWINKGESQCISQENIYAGFTKMEVSLPLHESEKELWHAKQLINTCINTATSDAFGPVHLNIPLEEPLHNTIQKDIPKVKSITTSQTENTLTKQELNSLASVVEQSKQIIILAGQQEPNKALENMLAKWAEKTGSVVLKEHLSNLSHPSFCSNIDAVIASLNNNIDAFKPDLLISFGGQFVSKSLKQFLRKCSPKEHWHISLSEHYADTYQALTKVIRTSTFYFFNELFSTHKPKENIFWKHWKDKEKEVNEVVDLFIQQANFSDLTVFNKLEKYLPQHSVVHLGNSTPVRYSLICKQAKKVQYLSNRGTSGIDGSLSSAIGFASSSEETNTVILGDLSFFYDSNALWNKYLSKKICIIVINNGGGNIFSLIDGPSESPAFEEHFFAKNNIKAEALATAFELNYFKAENQNQLSVALKKIYSDEQKKPALLEIFTDATTNTKVFRDLFKQLKT